MLSIRPSWVIKTVAVVTAGITLFIGGAKYTTSKINPVSNNSRFSSVPEASYPQTTTYSGAPAATITKLNSSQQVDTDPVITCNFKYAGPQQMRKSACSGSVDCQIGSQWIALLRDECTKRQKDYYKPSYSRYYYTPLVPINPQNSFSNNVSPMPSPTPADTTAQLNDCLGKAQQTYQSLEQASQDSANQFNLSGESRDIALSQVHRSNQQIYQRSIDQCHQSYGY